MLLDIVSNGLGGQSMYLLWLAGQGCIPARVSITADTGSEQDRLWSTGERTTAKEYFEQVVEFFADKWGMDARFVRSRDKHGTPLPPLHENLKLEMERAARGEREAKYGAQYIPLFNSKGGRLKQSCTDRWKIAAIRQEARRMGATHLRSAQGIHFGEAARRVKGGYLGDEIWAERNYSVYQTMTKNKKTGLVTYIKWMTHYYPLVDLRMNREDVRRELEKLNIPFIVSSECDMCPHKDLSRWLRTSPEKLDEIAELEAMYGGDYFFTSERVPLKEAIRRMQLRAGSQSTLFDEDPDFGCGNSYCGV